MKIMAVTTTRADYGIMSGLLKALQESKVVDLRLVVTGTHLSEKFGYTKNEILRDKIEIAYEVDFPLELDSAPYLGVSTGSLTQHFSHLIDKEKPELLLVLGDRFEILAPVTAAVIHRIPVAHIHGGEITLGAIDNKIRDAVTQMSDIHFAATSAAADRIQRLKSNDRHIYHVGSLSVDGLNQMHFLDRAHLSKTYGWNLDGKAAIVTYHPETLAARNPEEQVEELLAALDCFPELFTVITLSNADSGGQRISKLLMDYATDRQNVAVHGSLGHSAYLSCLANFDVVIGNSSSAIIEAPFFGLPSVNIGDRQKGREMAESVICVACNRRVITAALDDALKRMNIRPSSPEGFPYGKPEATKSILAILEGLSQDCNGQG